MLIAFKLVNLHTNYNVLTSRSLKKIKNALISVFYKDNLEPIIRKLNEQGVIIYSTGGTQNFIEGLGVKVIRLRI